MKPSLLTPDVAVDRVDVWSFHAKRMPSSVRRPMYRITGHYPMIVSVGWGR